MIIIKETKDLRIFKAFILLQCIMWGIGTPITRFVYLSITPFCYMVVRFGIAALILGVIFCKYIKEDLKWEKLRGCTLTGVFVAGTYIFANLAVAEAMVTIAGFLMGISVVFTAIFSVAFLKTKLDIKFTLSLILVLVGMYMMCCGGVGGFSFGLGEFYALMSSVCMASSLMLSAKYVKNVNPATLSIVQCIITGIISVGFAFAFEDFACLKTALPISWASLLFICLGCTVGSFMLQNVSLKHLSALFVSLVYCLQPIFTAIASLIILKETVAIVGVAGGVFITIGIVIATIKTERDKNKISAEL